LWTPQIGGGRVLSKRWSWDAQTGYAAGKVRTKANDPSILILPLHTDFEIKRGAFFLGTGVDYFPWGMPEQRKYEGIRDRLKGARPFVGLDFTSTYATFRAKVKVGFPPIPNLDIELSDGWLVNSVNAHVGVDIPWDERKAVSINFGYNRFDDRRFDFEGLALSITWKYYLRRD